jgi:hypothetical protein
VVQNFVRWSRVGIFHNKPLDPPHWTRCFVAFRAIWVHLGQFVALQHSVRNGLNWCKSSCHEVASEFFVANAPNLPHWTLNSCFGVFWTIWVHLVLFGYLTKLGAKRAEVVQNFVPWSRVGIFHSKPLDPPHWTLTSCFVAFRIIWVHLGQFVVLQHSVQNGPNLCKSSCHDVASEYFATNAPNPPLWTLNSCFGVFCTIWLHLVPFGYLTKLGAKRAEVVQNFVPWSRVGIFHNKPLDPPHWTRCFVAFHTIWMHLGPFGCLTKLNAKRAEVVQKFVPWSRVRIFRSAFCTIWMCLDRLVALQNSMQNGPNWCKSSCHGVAS